MSTADPTGHARGADPYAPGGVVHDDFTATSEDAGYGWVVFAGTLLALLAMLNFIDGVAAVSNSTFFVGGAKLVISGLDTWGWVLIGISAVQLLTAFGVFAQVRGARWVGVAIASVNAIAQLLVMPSYPFWALCLFALDILVIYGLIAHGARSESAV